MRFTVSQSAFAKALAVVSKGIAAHSTLPVLSGVLMRADNGTLEMQTSDLDTSIRHKIAANVEEPGETVISGRVLSSIVKNLADASITFDGGQGTIHLTCQNSSFHLNTLSAEEFPNFPEVAMDRHVELPRDVLSTMVDMVYKVVSKDPSHPALAGVLLNVEENLVRLVASDGYRAAMCDTQVATPDLTDMFEMIVPGNAFHDALTLPSESETVTIGDTANQAIFVFGNTTYVTRRIEAQFPNWRGLLPKDVLTSMTVKVADIAGALRRVSSIAAQGLRVKIEVDPTEGSTTLSSSSPDQGDAREVMQVEAQGEPNTIYVNYRYFGDGISAADQTGDITLELQQAGRPGVFKAYGKINYLYILMPLRGV